MTPTLLVDHYTKAGTDVYGQPVLTKGAGFKVAPVKLLFGEGITSVRTDSTATHGNASENVADVVVLAPYTAAIKLKDQLVILGNKCAIVSIHPRFTAMGQPDHLEVHCSAWK